MRFGLFILSIFLYCTQSYGQEIVANIQIKNTSKRLAALIEIPSERRFQINEAKLNEQGQSLLVNGGVGAQTFPIPAQQFLYLRISRDSEQALTVDDEIRVYQANDMSGYDAIELSSPLLDWSGALHRRTFSVVEFNYDPKVSSGSNKWLWRALTVGGGAIAAALYYWSGSKSASVNTFTATQAAAPSAARAINWSKGLSLFAKSCPSHTS